MQSHAIFHVSQRFASRQLQSCLSCDYTLIAQAIDRDMVLQINILHRQTSTSFRFRHQVFVHPTEQMIPVSSYSGLLSKSFKFIAYRSSFLSKLGRQSSAQIDMLLALVSLSFIAARLFVLADVAARTTVTISQEEARTTSPITTVDSLYGLDRRATSSNFIWGESCGFWDGNSGTYLLHQPLEDRLIV